MRNSPAAVLFTLSAATCSVMVGLGIIWPLLPVLAVQFGATGVMLGVIIASYNISRTVFSTVVGRLSDRFGRRNFILAGLALYTAVSLAYVAADSPTMLIAVRLAHGLAALLVVPICMALAGDIAPKGQLGSYLGTVNLALMTGLGLGPTMGGVLFERMGMDAAFYSMGVLSVVAGMFVALCLPSDRESGAVVRHKGGASLKAMFLDRTAVALMLMRFFMAVGQGSVYSFLPIYAMHVSLTSFQVGVLLSVNIFIVALMQRPVGRWMDRGNPKPGVLAGMFVCALSILPMPFVGGFYPLLAMNALMGLASGLTFPGSLVIAGHLGRTMGMGSLMSVADAAWTLGLILSPILSGLILDRLGIAHVFTLGAATILAGSVVVSVLLRGYLPPEDQGNIV